MNDYDTQRAIETFRAEAQADRLALQQYIQEGFDKLSTKFEEHAEQDRQMFTSVGSRVQDLETFRSWSIRVGAALGGTLTTGLVSWIAHRWS